MGGLLSQPGFLLSAVPAAHAEHAAGKIFGGGMVSGIIFRQVGIFSMGLRYASPLFCLLLPAFFFFFTAGGQRLSAPAVLPASKPLSLLGLNGRGRPALTLGFGCGTMAVAVTRILDSRRERFLATFYWPWECPVRPSWKRDLPLKQYPGRFLAGPWWWP